MSSVAEIMAGFSWLYTVLSTDSALTTLAPGGVRRSLAPPGTPTPYIIMAYQSGLDSVTMNAYRVLADMLYQCKAVGPATITANIAAAAARIDELIGKPPASGTTTGGYISASYRQQALLVDEIVNGEEWTNLGGLYRLEIQQM